MTSWNILIADTLEQSGLAVLHAAAHVSDRSGITAQALKETLPGYDALIVRSRTKITADLLAAASRLKVVGRAGVGVDNIDLQAARARGVVVVNAPSANSQAVAEFTLGLIFSLARQIPRADAASKDGLWLKDELLGLELAGKSLGVVGLGNIGTIVARLAKGLDLQVLGYDYMRSPREITRLGAQPVSLRELYARSDIVSFHIPLTDETRGLVDGAALSQMKPGVRLICTARGGIIDEEALLEALESGQVAGAALDVFAQEPPGKTALVAHPNLIATPHIGAQTVEAQSRTAEQIAQEVLAALNGLALRWRVV